MRFVSGSSNLDKPRRLADRIPERPGATTMTLLPDTLCYLNGDFLPLNQAKVSVMDRGFLFGDGAYESIPVYGRRMFRFDDHFARLERSLGKLEIEADLDREAWLARLRRVIAAHPADDQLVYIQVTRGVALRSHVAPIDLEPTVFVNTSERASPTPAQRLQGLSCVTARDFRWQRGDIKSISLLGNVLARKISSDEGADETVLLRDDEPAGPWLTEGASSNVWVVHEGALLGPAPDGHVLQGVRIELLRELCAETGIAFNLRPVSEADVRAADEVLLSSASKEIIAVTRLDGEQVGHGALRGRPGPVYARLHEAYQRAIQSQSI
jgi:D-alanine transaminase